MAELKRHRDLSETVFGLALAERLEPSDIDGRMLVYPYNRAIEDLPEASAAELSIKYGHEAIQAAMHAAEMTNGIAPHHWVEQLVTTFRDYKVVNIMGRMTKKIDQGETIDWGAELDNLSNLVAPVQNTPMAWADIKGEFLHEWMWNGWIPANELTLLVGWQEAGKSAVALALADAFANGTALPDGSYCPKQTKVLWIETEGRHGENIFRSRQWNIKTENIFSPVGNSRKVMDLTNPEDKALIRAHAMNPEIGVVMIDSLGGSLMNENEASAKKILQEIAMIAQETLTTFIIIHHLRKPQGKDKGIRPTLHMVRGHGGITQFSPSVIAIEYDPDMPQRVLFSLKNNFIEKPRDILFSIGTFGPLFTEDTAGSVQRAVRDEFIEWISKLDGPISSKDLLERAEEEGYEKEIVKLAIRHPSLRVYREDGITYISKKERSW